MEVTRRIAAHFLCVCSTLLRFESNKSIFVMNLISFPCFFSFEWNSSFLLSLSLYLSWIFIFINSVFGMFEIHSGVRYSFTHTIMIYNSHARTHAYTCSQLNIHTNNNIVLRVKCSFCSLSHIEMYTHKILSCIFFFLLFSSSFTLRFSMTKKNLR